MCVQNEWRSSSSYEVVSSSSKSCHVIPAASYCGENSPNKKLFLKNIFLLRVDLSFSSLSALNEVSVAVYHLLDTRGVCQVGLSDEDP